MITGVGTDTAPAASMARTRYPDQRDDFFIKPADIAEELWHAAHQTRSAWSFLTELRPFNERW